MGDSDRDTDHEIKLEDTIGYWHGIYDLNADDGIDWLLYVASCLVEKGRRQRRYMSD